MSATLFDDYFRPWKQEDVDNSHKDSMKTETPSLNALDLSNKSPQKKESTGSTGSTLSDDDESVECKHFSPEASPCRSSLLKEMDKSCNKFSDVPIPKSSDNKIFSGLWNPLQLHHPILLQQIQAYCQFVNNFPLLQLQHQQHHQRLLEESREFDSKNKSNSTSNLKPIINHALNGMVFPPMLLNNNNNKLEMDYPPSLHNNNSLSVGHGVKNLTIPQQTHLNCNINSTDDLQGRNSNEPATHTHYPLPSAKDGEPLDLLPKSLYMNKAHGGHLCIFCGKLYSRKYGLKIHLRTHTGYKPLKCKICQRPFGDPSNLNKHIRLHAEGETPYRCNYCGKVLVRRRDLERHIRSRHPSKADNELFETENISPSKYDITKDPGSDFEAAEELDVVG